MFEVTLEYVLSPSPTLLYLSRDDTRESMVRTAIMYCWWRQCHCKGSTQQQRYKTISAALKNGLSVVKFGRELDILVARRGRSGKKDTLVDLINMAVLQLDHVMFLNAIGLLKLSDEDSRRVDLASFYLSFLRDLILLPDIMGDPMQLLRWLLRQPMWGFLIAHSSKWDWSKVSTRAPQIASTCDYTSSLLSSCFGLMFSRLCIRPSSRGYSTIASSVPKEVDTLIVGGGIIGVATAYQLSRLAGPSHRILLVEQNT
ncbi:hypothetical protein FOZ62_003207, partial [Perkinsus olseni]